MFFSVIFLLGVAVVSQSAVLPNYEFDPHIVNGKNVTLGEIPYQISLQRSSSHFCGGSIINKYYVVTAAHCVASESPETIVVVAGTVNLNDPQAKHAVEQKIVHKYYNPSNSWINDIALLRVATPFVPSRNIAFVTLPKQNEFVKEGSVATVSGFGDTEKDVPSKILKRATIYIANQQRCKEAYKPFGQNVYDSQICANDPSMRRGSCSGDSGGPLTVNGTLVGLVSWALRCARPDYPTVYTRVPSYVNWIKEHAVY